MVSRGRWIYVGCLLGFGIAEMAIAPSHRVLAQIVPDATLPENSNVTTDGNLQRITGGTEAGSNLFHSLSEFNVRTGETAHFDNALTIDNIITRVTGSQLSNLDGILRVNGSANLFLINPNGIVFGANAQLDIGGSFVASTASGINFADGSEFLATGGDAPLLTVSVPVGLQFNGSNSGTIASNGANLAVPTGQTLGLVGGDITVSGGTLVAGGNPLLEVDSIPISTMRGGRIELGSVASGEVGFVASSTRLSFDYDTTAELGDIQLRATDAIAAGSGGGDIQIVAGNLGLSDRARILSLTQGTIAGGNITVRATESVELMGMGDFEETALSLNSENVDFIGFEGTGLFNLTANQGNSGDITIETGRFIARNNSAVLTATQQEGNSGNLRLDVSDSVEVTASLLGTGTGVSATGNGGNLTIETSNLRLQENSLVLANTLSSGNGGDLIVKADAIELSRGQPYLVHPLVFSSTTLGTVSFGSGDAGNISIETRTLTLQGLAQLSASALEAGGGGTIAVNASESIEIIGTEPLVQPLGAPFNTNITSISLVAGDAGAMTITTPRFIVTEGAIVSTTTFGTGRGGDITINASELVEVTGGQPLVLLPFTGANTNISTFTLTGASAGDLHIATPNLVVRDGGSIVVDTFGSGRGGDLTIEAGSIEVTGKSPDDISRTIVSAVNRGSFGRGTGGNLTIRADRLTVSDRARVGADSRMNGDAGTVDIEVGELIVRDRGTINAENRMDGNAGNLNIDAESILLDTEGRLIATTTAGEEGNIRLNANTVQLRRGSTITTDATEEATGGNITINTDTLAALENSQITANAGFDNRDNIATNAAGESRGGSITINSDTVQLRRGSTIATNAAGEATGGNITINTDTLAALENSDITANAEDSFGGRVAIDAIGIFGTAFRENPTPNSDITASSEQGAEFSGTVTITTPDIDPSSGLVELSSATLDTEGLLARSCLTPSSSQRSRFVVVGAGGLPARPDNRASLPFETFAVPAVLPRDEEISDITLMTSPAAIVEAEGIFQLEDDRFVLGRLCS